MYHNTPLLLLTEYYYDESHYDTDKSDDGWIMGSPVRREKESDPINTRLQILKDRVLC